jgi:solute carrier family 24 (sodium/potassium/calcium exchanger), member 6
VCSATFGYLELLIGGTWSDLTFWKGSNKGALLYLLAAAAAGISAGVIVLIFADTGADTAGRLARCFMGFIVAVVWIMIIADEVVSVLKVCTVT